MDCGNTEIIQQYTENVSLQNVGVGNYTEVEKNKNGMSGVTGLYQYAENASLQNVGAGNYTEQ